MPTASVIVNRYLVKMGQGEGSGGSTESQGSGGVLWQVIWLVLLLLAAIWVAGFCAWWYIMLIPFTVCIPQAAAITDILLRGTQLTYFCAKNMMQANTLNEAWNNAAATVPPTVLVVQNAARSRRWWQ
ncbi:hypothetical protein Pmani_039316 [Petrolisthes manimaculis]|uniref:Uncharacterized protein n=1 Tax=Petrolisthes manimaculis TaxID=1843537 RepID=A0AAE1NEG9_9EUCA|nr:hypothetical protein Pmani_039316 [Petrolisthes manimaculis]